MTDATSFFVFPIVEGALPEDDDNDIYITIEVIPPGESDFEFVDNAQVDRSVADNSEPVEYLFHTNAGPGTYTFRAIIDEGGLIDESDEDNNESDSVDIDTDDGGGDNSCGYAFDGECDEPEGTNLCLDGTDSADCA